METTNDKGAKVSLDSLSSLFGDSYKEYKERFSVLTEITLLPVLIVFLGYALIFIGGLFSVIGLLVLIAGWVTLIFSSLALIFSVHNNTGVDASYQAITKFFWPYIWLSILAALALLGSTAMLIIPGIWLAVALSLKSYTLVLENRKGMDALAQSKKYIDGYWWAFLGRALLMAILFGVVSMIFNILFSFFGKFGPNFASAVTLLFVLPFFTIFYYKIYQNLRTLKPELHEAQHSGKGFLKIASIVGVIIAVLLAIALVFLIVYAFRNSDTIKMDMSQGNYNLQYPASNQ